MAEFSIRSDAVDVEQIMRQVRARIREKRGVDYTEQEIRQLANARLETFLDPSRVRSDLLAEFRRVRTQEPPLPNFAFEDTTIFETHRGPLRLIRRLLRPLLKLFFNPNPIAEALHIQARLNASHADRLSRMETLYYELIHNLVVEVTRLGIEVKNLRMTVDSVAGRLDFDERRARALEGAVQYRPAAPPRQAAVEHPRAGERTDRSAAGERLERSDRGPAVEDAGERRRRRRRRGRRRHAGAPGAVSGGAAPESNGGSEAAAADQGGPESSGPPADTDEQP